MFPHAHGTSASQLCPPGHGSDHPRRVSELDRAGNRAPGQLRHLRRPQPDNCREGRPLRVCQDCRLLLRSAGHGQSWGEPQSLQPRQSPAERSVRLCSPPSCRAGPPPFPGPDQRGFGGRGGAAATGRPDPAGAIATSGLSSCWPGNTFCMMGLCWLSPNSRDISPVSFVIRITKVRYQCLRLAASAPQRSKTRSPARVTGGTSGCSDYQGLPTAPPRQAAGGVRAPGCPVPASSHAAVRAGQGGKGQTMVRNMAPAVLSRGSRRGQNPREAPLVRLQDVPDTLMSPVPLRRGSAAGQWNVREQNTCPSSQCRLPFALFNLCVFVNLAASFVLQVLWPSKLLSGG